MTDGAEIGHAAAPAPLILTLRLDPVAQRYFDGLRREHFPASRNHLDAHLTLFHALPALHRDSTERLLSETVAARGAPELRVTGLRSLGRGVAFEIESADLLALRAGLARSFTGWLTPQDAQTFRPHVTVQNKVAPEAARALLAALGSGFTPFVCRGEALALWRYLGGPWEALSRHRFGSAAV